MSLVIQAEVDLHHVPVIMELMKMLMETVNHVIIHVKIVPEMLILVILVLTKPEELLQNVHVMQDIMILDQQNAHHVTSNVLNVTLITIV